MFQYKSQCFTNLDQALLTMAADCSLLDSNGNAVACTVSGSQIQITKTNEITSSSFFVTPAFPDCVIDVGQIDNLINYGFILIFTALAIMYIKRVVR